MGLVMAHTQKPPLDGLKRQLARKRVRPGPPRDTFVRETYTLPRPEARVKAREWFDRYPKAAYWTSVESWRLLPDGSVEFTMRRLPSAD
ncbi:hypothetical protein SAMN02745911_1401 [Aureimonas altamirensis DSM 21988]|jgi:hypothetical protein|uniref:Uncharacterized protein n=1 Tax=Aureimonas altamirensis DSM 21988 TaxID=1121026 RepID=A0ABY1IDD7_9HYPH|nr:hypothetical protein SAMN02745911_1401 [Aureimonas altamirensis DSM 21988]